MPYLNFYVPWNYISSSLKDDGEEKYFPFSLQLKLSSPSSFSLNISFRDCSFLALRSFTRIKCQTKWTNQIPNFYLGKMEIERKRKREGEKLREDEGVGKREKKRKGGRESEREGDIES